MKIILSYLKSVPSNLSSCKFCARTEMSKYGTKHPLFGYFWSGILKNYCHILYRRCQIYAIAKFNKKNILNFEPKIFYLGVLGSSFEKLLPYLKSVPSNLFDCKISCKDENGLIGDQKRLIWYYWHGILTINIFEISTLEFVKNEFSILLKIRNQLFLNFRVRVRVCLKYAV